MKKRTDRACDLPARMLEVSCVRIWLKTKEPRGASIVSFIVRAGACSPSNAPSRRALQIVSAIVEHREMRIPEREKMAEKTLGLKNLVMFILAPLVSIQFTLHPILFSYSSGFHKFSNFFFGLISYDDSREFDL